MEVPEGRPHPFCLKVEEEVSQGQLILAFREGVFGGVMHMLSVGCSGRSKDKAPGRFTLVVYVSECMVAFGVDRCRLWVPVVTAVNASITPFKMSCLLLLGAGAGGLCVLWLRYGQRVTSGSRSSPSTLFEKV